MKKVYLIIIMLLSLTLSGCNFISGMVLEDKLTNHLNEKYDKEFKITKLVKEFDGNHGWHYRAVFHEKGSQENSVLYCYKDDFDEGTIIKIKGEEHAVVDDYADIILQEQYAALIQEELGDDVLVKCQFLSLNYMISDEEFAAGLEACLNDDSRYQSVTVYVIADKEKMTEKLRERAEKIMELYKPYHQYLYVSYQAPFDAKAWEEIYYENNDVYSHEFTGCIKDDSTVKRIEYTSFTRESGLKETKVIKE